ncbi:protein tyrosine kinase domain containing protein [Entamoeba histolytica HM-1:IMSS-B]|uniref:Protein tyrosine kinase domain containing protein n=1 Tax=Entamoeba histolytica HM-1:IMSS-B TaxID=885319 RepID=M3UWT9_ENTH1|nr:protein tyrosine kinase domain containing protein [Entamoeba histolytica HM-1:IMSS-B]
MWYGEGKCKEVQIDKVKGCGDVFTSSSDTSDYEIKLNFTSTMKQINKEVTPAAPEQLYINRCTRYVHPTKPYTYGQYLKVTLPAGQENTYISIAIDKQYNRDDLVLAQLQEQKEGHEFGIIIQEDCISGTNLRDKVNCLYRNGGLSEYILSPRVVTWMNADSTQYIFIHKKYASSPMTKFQIFFTKVKHPCSNNYYDIDWNDIAGDGYSRIVNLEHTLNSRSICSKDLIKGFWFRIKGAEQTIVISTCQSENYDVSLDLIKTKTDTSNAEAGSINCESSDSVECVKSRSDGCGTNSKLAKMVVTLSEDNTYYLFLGINEEYSAEVLLTVDTTCPLSCGENGICSAYSGRCECKPGFVFKDEGCTECGNGVVDANEDCDLSSGVNDTQCTDSNMWKWKN